MASESEGITRTIKEAMYHRVNNLPFNRNLGKYQLLHIWDGALQNMPTLCLQLTLTTVIPLTYSEPTTQT